MKASTAIAKILNSMVEVLAKRDEENRVFQAQLLQTLGDVKRTGEANNQMLREVQQYIGKHDREITLLKEDLETISQARQHHA